MRGKTHCTVGILAYIQSCIFLKLPISVITLFLSVFFSLLPDLDEPSSTISSFFLNRKLSKKILKNIVFFLSLIIFIYSITLNNNYYMSSLLFVCFIIFNESKLNNKNLRKLFISLIFMLLSTIAYMISKDIYISVLILFLSIFPWLKHRGFSHSILAICLIYFLLKNIEEKYNIKYLALLSSISYSSHIFLGDIFTKSGVAIFYPISSKKISLSPFSVGSYWCNVLEYIFIAILLLSIFITSISL
ncbi:MAG: metal-dependent hydrolase [Peptostreptococcaceae bacterium]